MKQKGKRKLAWLLSITVALSSNSFAVMADDLAETEVIEESQDIELEEENEDAGQELLLSEEEEIPAESMEETEIETEDISSEGITAEQEELFSAGEEETEQQKVTYFFPEDEEKLAGWGHFVERKISYYIEGTGDGETEITELSVANEEGDEDEEPVYTVESENENGWSLVNNRCGTAVISFKYKDIQGEIQEGEFRLYVNGDKYTLDYTYPESESFMLKNDTKTIPLQLYHEWNHDEDDRGEKWEENWKLEFDPDEDGNSYETSLIDVKIQDHEIIVTSAEDNAGYTQIRLKAVIENEEGQEETVAGCGIWMEVSDGYYIILPQNLDNVEFGETLDLNSCNFQLKWIEEGKEIINPEGISLVPEWTSEQWSVEKNEDGKLPVLKRITKDEARLSIRAENTEGSPVWYKNYSFGGMDYSVWFENLREDEYSTYVYDDETDHVLHLNTTNLQDKKNIHIKWSVGYRMDDQESEDGQDHFSEEIPEEMKFWTEADDSADLHINGTRLAEAVRWLAENKGDNYWFEARVRVVKEDEEEWLEEAQAGINSREAREEYYLPEDKELLVGENRYIDKRFGCLVENSEYPESDEREIEITELSVSNEEGDENSEPVCTVERDGDNGWNIRAEHIGTAVVTYKYQNVHGDEITEHFNCYVSLDKFSLDFIYPESEECMLKNDTKKFSAVLNHEWRYGDEEEGNESVKDWKLELSPDDNNWCYDENLINVSLDGYDVNITSKDQFGWGTDVRLKASVKDENGEWVTVTENSIRIEVSDGYHMLLPQELDAVQPGDTLDLNKCGLEVKWVEPGSEPQTAQDVHYDIEYDKNQWTDLNTEEESLPVLRRDTADDTWINIVARDRNNNEIRRREFYFDRLDYDVWFENLREDDYSTYLFEGEEYELLLNTERLQDKKNQKIQWEAGFRLEEDAEGNDGFTTEIPEEYVFWNAKADDRITLSAEKLKEAYDWLYEAKGENYWFEIRAYVMVGNQEVGRAQAGINSIREPEYSYQTPDYDRNIRPGEEIWIEDNFNCYVQDPEYPYGENIPVKITRMAVLDTDVCQLIPQKNGWLIRAKECGEAVVTFVYNDLNGQTRTGNFVVYVDETVYYVNFRYEDGMRDMLPSSEKKIIPEVYRKDKDHPEGIKLDPSAYALGKITEEDYNKDAISNINVNDDASITVTSKDVGDTGSNIHILVTSVEKDDNGAPLWQTEGDVDIWIMDGIEYRIALEKEGDTNPRLNETFDLKEYEPYVLQYDSGKKEWNKTEENIRFRLEYDENVWKPEEETENERIPVLTRISNARTVIRVAAEKEVYDSRYDRYNWEEIISRDFEFDTWAVCEHIWSEPVVDEAATCTKPGKQHRECTICEIKEEEQVIPATGEHTWVTVTDKKVTCGTDGKQHAECSVCKETKNLPDIKATGNHTWSSYKVSKEATVLTEGEESRTCSICKKTDIRKTAKLKASINVEAAAFPLQKGKSVTVRITGLNKGDSVKSVISSKAGSLKAAVVNGGIKLTARKASGKVKVTVLTAGGASKVINVTLQKKKVTTGKISGIQKKLTLKKGKTLVLKPVLSPITSQDKVTYTSSDPKVAKVDKKGKIRARKAGKATITVKAGKKIFRCTVKVTK